MYSCTLDTQKPNVMWQTSLSMSNPAPLQGCTPELGVTEGASCSWHEQATSSGSRDMLNMNIEKINARFSFGVRSTVIRSSRRSAGDLCMMTRRSWFTATPRHERHSFDEGAADRFEAPKASLNFSSNGRLLASCCSQSVIYLLHGDDLP